LPRVSEYQSMGNKGLRDTTIAFRHSAFALTTNASFHRLCL
jgi:hypothetical protein